MGMMGFKMHPIASVNGKCSTKLPKFLVHCGPDPFSTSFLLCLSHGLLRWFASCLTVSTVHFRHVHFISTILALDSYYIFTDSRFLSPFTSWFVFIFYHATFRDKHTLLRTTQLLRCVRKGFWSKHRKRLTGPKSIEYVSCLLRSFCALVVFLRCSYCYNILKVACTEQQN